MSDIQYLVPLRKPKFDVAQALQAKAEGLHRALSQMGYSELRTVQRIPVDNILANRDILVVAPTSAGKSAMYTVPTLALGWRTLVFSPLISLMRDQVTELARRGIRADFVNSHQSTEANNRALAEWAHGKLQMLYVSPERQAKEEFQAAMTQAPPDLVVVDEAHCLSQWGDNFRPEYQRIGEFVAKYNPKVVAAFTATCTEEIEEDICRVLGIPPNCVIWQYYRRNNLALHSRELVSDYDIVHDLENIPGKAVIYFSTVKRLEQFAPWLQERIGAEVSMYHGQLDRSVRANLQDAFKISTNQVMCATNAFGLGVNVEDIRLVIHHDPPGSPEALAQELGRAGRDEQPSTCITYWSKEGWRTQSNFIELGHPDEKTIRAVALTMQKLGAGGTVIKKTANELADLSHVSRHTMQAVMHILDSSGVIRTVKSEDKIAKITFVGNSTDDRFQQYKREVLKGGMVGSNSCVEINLEWLRQQIGCTEDTLRRWFKNWADSGLIQYVPPFRGSPRVVIGDVSRIDFKRLAKKRTLAWKKLDMVQKYVDVPDGQKHDWLEDYFSHWRGKLIE